MTIRQFKRVIFIFLLACGWLAAQKGQPAASPSQGGASGQPSVPPQLYPLDQIPQTRAQAEANMTGNVFHPLEKPHKGGYPWNQKSPPRYVWYKTTKTNSFAIPVILVPMTCADVHDPKNPMPGSWGKGGADYDEEFAKECADGANPKRTPSQPTQNWNPLRLGDGLILAIYDGERLFSDYDTRLLGMTIQSQNGATLYPDALQPAIGAAGAPAAGSGASQVPQGAGGTAAGSLNGRCSSDAIGNLNQLNLPETYKKATETLDFSAPGKIPRPFYYIPWIGNPLLGDTMLSVAIVAQGPSVMPLTVALSGVAPGDRVGPKFKVCDGDWQLLPVTLAFASGSRVQVEAAGNDDYMFVGWSDGGAWQHDVAIGSSPVNLTAEFVRRTDFIPVTVLSNPRGADVRATLPLVITQAGDPLPGVACRGVAPVFLCPPGPIVVSAPASQGFNGNVLQAQSWSDGQFCGEVTGLCTDDTVVVGKEPITLVVNYANLSQMAPSPASLTLVGDTSGLLATVNGVGYIMPQLVPVPPGASLQVDAPVRQQARTNEYAFNTWQNFPLNPFTLTAPSTGSTLVAGYFSTPAAFAGTCALNVATSPAGLFVGVGDGVNKIFASNAGAGSSAVKVPDPAGPPRVIAVTATLDATLPQYLNGVLYTFQSWSDGGAARHPATIAYSAVPPVPTVPPTVPAPPPTWGCMSSPPTYTATFAASTAGTAIPVTVSTDPQGLGFSMNGIAEYGATTGFFAPGSTVTVNTSPQQSLAGIQYTFTGWSDSSASTVTDHSFSVPSGSAQNASPGAGGATPAPPSAAVTAIFTPGATGPTEQPLTLLNTIFPQTHNLSRFTIASGIVFSWMQSKSWSRQETAPAVTCPAGSPQPCIASTELYQTVPNPLGTHSVDPVLFLTIYTRRLDSERKWHPKDLTPALNLGLALTSPSTDFFVGLASEVLVRGLQVNAGMHIGQVSQLSPVVVNDPTSSAAPATYQRFQKAAYLGVTFNLNFIQTLFSAAKGGA